MLKPTLLAVAAFASAAAVSSATPVLIDFQAATGTDAAGPINVFEPGVVLAGMTDLDGSVTTIGLAATTGVGGGANGALATADPSLLGIFGVDALTSDYVFNSGGVTGFRYSGLDPNAVYDLSFFGTRDTTSTRITTYTVTGGDGTSSVDLQTSGENIGSDGVYDGNDDTIATISGVSPTAAGTIDFSFEVQTGGFSYLGGASIVAVPEPTAAAASLGLFGLLLRRRTA